MQTTVKIPSRCLRSRYLSCWLLIFVVAAPVCHAARTMDFSLQLTRTELELGAAGKLYPVDLKRINVTMYENVNKGMDIGLMIGSSFLGLDNDSHSAGLGLNGYHLGVTARNTFGNNPRLGLQAHYLLQEVQGSNNSNSIAVDWYEWQLSSNLRFAPTHDWGIILGAAVTGVDADRRVSGNINEKLQMSLEDNIYGFLEIEMLSPPDGRVSLTLQGGGQQGIGLSFARLF